jgi:hydrogenase maturation protease
LIAVTTICVIGVGNSWASDDGIAPILVDRVRTRYSDSDFCKGATAVSFIVVPFLDVSLLNVIDQCEIVVLVDAVKGNASPGSIHRQIYQPEVLVSKGVERTSSHGVGVREILALASALDRLPDLVFLWGVEVVSTEPGTVMSAVLSSKLPDLERQLLQDLQELSEKLEV